MLEAEQATLIEAANGGEVSLSVAFEPPEHRRRRLDVIEEMIELTGREIARIEQGVTD